VAIYQTTVSTNGSGDGTNLDANGNPQWNGYFRGLLMAVKFDFASATDAGSDTTLTEPVGLGRTLATLANSKTDTTFYPRVLETDNAAVSIGSYTMMQVDSGNLKVTIAQGGATVTGAVTVIVDILEN
jgi:hypothetical protein